MDGSHDGVVAAVVVIAASAVVAVVVGNVDFGGMDSAVAAAVDSDFASS